MGFSISEELGDQQQRLDKERKIRFDKDKLNGTGKNGALSTTEGLKPVVKNCKKYQRFVEIDDDTVVDLSRVRKLSDVRKEDE